MRGPLNVKYALMS